ALPPPDRARGERRAGRGGRGAGLRRHARGAARAARRRGARPARPGAALPARLLLRAGHGVARRRALGLAADGHAGRLGEGGGDAVIDRLLALVGLVVSSPVLALAAL